MGCRVIWAIHGGGIYHLEKYKLAPKMPENLHWFKWEAYFTWMSGIALLCVVFYWNPTLYLLALAYPQRCRRRSHRYRLAGRRLVHLRLPVRLAAGQKPALLGAVLFVLIIAACWGFSLVFSGRGACTPARSSAPSWSATCSASSCRPSASWWPRSRTTRRPTVLPAKGLLRSRHNNYFTLPVLFIMISNHFPSTYGSRTTG